jgi:deazaflavin-dependent oxidoreductase (nitroreductase family)
MRAYHKLVDSFARTRLGGWTVLHLINPIDQRLMRWTNGALSSVLGTDFRDNGVLLRCTGARSGQPRQIPLLATPLDDQFVLIASAAASEKNPGWYYNLKANPECSLLVPRQGEINCVAHEAKGEERERGWAAANALYSGYTTYQGRTKRRIPVMILTPVSPE